ncbi:MAG: ATP-dependent DNA helicase [Clostridia bacterium]|nr:ATP-dependent DNA helicase [Clostridia bacterium]
MRYNSELATIELSVSELCALAHRSGHLDARRPRRIGRQARAVCYAEVFAAPRTELLLLRNTTVYHGISYTVEGIADAVVQEGTSFCVEAEKKRRTTQSDLFSQLRCYAYFLSAVHHLTRVSTCIRAADATTGEVRERRTEMSADQLYNFYISLLERVEPLARQEILRREERIPSVQSVGFPYPHPREGQTELAETTFRAIRKGQRLFAEAPTGIGKTVSTLYPAVKALGMGLCERIFYLTPKASTRREAYAAAGKLFAAGARLRTVVLHAKEQMCLCEGGPRQGGTSRCNPERCPYACGYYDRSQTAVLELLSKGNGFPRTSILEAGKRHRVCPYELSLDLSEFCEIIICDYNYAFSPDVYLRRYFDAEEGERGSYVFLIDEAHNLPDRARDMYSMRLVAKPFAELYACIDPEADGALEQTLGAFLTGFGRLGELCTENRTKSGEGLVSGYYLNRAPLSAFADLVRKTEATLTAFLHTAPEHALAERLTELSGELRRYLLLNEYYDEHFLTYIELVEGEVSVQLFCLDPSAVLNAAMNRARSAILFSATFTPLDYFADVLGGGKRAVQLQLPSPYDPDRLCVTVMPGVSTRYEDRDKSYRRVATMIAASVSAKAGNYMVYFPSYDYMEKVLERFTEKYPKVPYLAQRRGMTPAEQAEFFEFFKEDEGKLRVGFCILGGSFSEGIDLPGNRLIGVVVVGTGLPGLSNERNILRDYYENKCERGYDYAYTFPGMNRVLQAAGRVIRRESDRGIVVLIDGRYAEEPYLSLYPAHWKSITVAGDAASLAHRLQLFWQSEDAQGK